MMTNISLSSTLLHPLSKDTLKGKAFVRLEQQSTARLEHRPKSSASAQQLQQQQQRLDNLLACFSVAFRDHCTLAPLKTTAASSSSSSSSRPAHPLLVAQSLIPAFRQVESQFSYPVVSENAIKRWVKRTAFGKGQALDYNEFMSLCREIVNVSGMHDPIEDDKAKSRPGTTKAIGYIEGIPPPATTAAMLDDDDNDGTNEIMAGRQEGGRSNPLFGLAPSQQPHRRVSFGGPLYGKGAHSNDNSATAAVLVDVAGMVDVQASITTTSSQEHRRASGGVSYQASWDQLTYEKFGHVPSADKKSGKEGRSGAFTNAPSSSVLTNGEGYTSGVPQIDASGPSSLPGPSSDSFLHSSTSTTSPSFLRPASVPYLVVKRSAALAATFDYDDVLAPDSLAASGSVPHLTGGKGGRTIVQGLDLVDIAKRQSRAKRKAGTLPPKVGERLFVMHRQGENCMGPHLHRESAKEVFDKTQTSKKEHETLKKEGAATRAMANKINISLGVVMRQIIETKANDALAAEQEAILAGVRYRTNSDKAAALKFQAKSDRSATERRRAIEKEKEEIRMQLEATQEEKANDLKAIRDSKQILVRRSITSRGTLGLMPPIDNAASEEEKVRHKKEARKQREEGKMQYSASLSALKETQSTKKALRNVFSAASIVVDGEVLFASPEKSPGGWELSPGGSNAWRSSSPTLHARNSPTQLLDRPKSRGETMPIAMFAAERIFAPGKVLPLSVGFGGPKAIVDIRYQTPASILREIKTPGSEAGEREMQAMRRDLLASNRVLSPTPSPWGN